MNCTRIWCVRASAPESDQLFLKAGLVALAATEVDDDAAKLPPVRQAFKDAFARGAPEAPAASILIAAGQLYRFVHEMRIGDSVIYPRKADRTLRWGEITGPYVFETDPLHPFSHRRGVRWMRKLSRDAFTPGALYELGSVLTLFEVRAFAEEYREKFADPGAERPASADGAESTIVRDIEETTRDFISRRIKTDLKGYALEPFVAALFRAMGYNAQATRRSRDDGVDVVAHRDELGIEPPILKIQVKAHEASIGADAVKAFYAMVEERDVGIFITTGDYTSGAGEFARAHGNLRLIDGQAFIDLIRRYYDRIELQFRQQVPLRKVLVPDVAEVA